MCDGDRSAAIIQADGFNSAFSLAHQIGHRYVFKYKPCREINCYLAMEPQKTIDSLPKNPGQTVYLMLFKIYIRYCFFFHLRLLIQVDGGFQESRMLIENRITIFHFTD